ncbi:MAG: FG-GAP-like repeat-containing protein [Anaerolineae bacterium]|nr:FG-GAP-like repeat-containing protein [Anaerolineae bacterium]
MALAFAGVLVVSCYSPGQPAEPSATAPAVPVADPALDRQLRDLLAAHGIGPLDPGPTPDPAKVALGRMLFFDKELSGNRDISCATCHHPQFATGDGIPLSVGTGGLGLGPERQRGAMRPFIPRNAPELFNRGSPEWRTMFWDGRVMGTVAEGFIKPYEFEDLVSLPDGLDSLLAAQALFPVTSPAEMRGERADVDVHGRPNELGWLDDEDLPQIWEGLMRRLLAIPGYRELFAAAYPDLPLETLGFQHAANALAAFEIHAFTLLDSPWDRYLAGDDSALSPQAKRGALLFYGQAGCARCHSGNLLTDQQFHNIGVPQIGPGKGRPGMSAHIDPGRARETNDPADRFRFRTPPLRNVAITGPWMHNGAYLTLEEAIRHHLDPKAALERYDLTRLPTDLQSDTIWNEAKKQALLETLDPLVATPTVLDDGQIADLLAFLEALTDPRAADLSYLTPEAVPSGLPVADALPQDLPYRDVTIPAGINMVHQIGYQMTGQAWADYDGDGWLDLYLTTGKGANALYRNNGDGTFSLSPIAYQVALEEHDSSGAVFADYDNDGWPDLYVVGRHEDVLFHNDGGKGFTDVTRQAGIDGSGAGKSASWGDYDADGFLDLYVANWSCLPSCPPPREGDRDRLYRNNGDGTFTDVSHLLGYHLHGAGFVAAFVDYDNDGDQDIYLVNDQFVSPIGNKLWRNDGPGCKGWCFTEVSKEAGANTRVMGMGLAVDDFNGDGWFDFYFSNVGPSTLLQNRRDGTFENVAEQAGVALDRGAISWGAASLDYDNDGWRDIYLALMDSSSMTPFNPLYRNNGDGTFTDLGQWSGAGDPGPGLGLALADYDRDGWTDIVVGNYDREYRLYRNQGAERFPDHRWLTLKLVGGGRVNRDAVGARVTVVTADGRRQVQEVRAGGTGVGGGSALELSFGLGKAALTSVEIRWPDGTTQSFTDLQPNSIYEIRYGGAVQRWAKGRWQAVARKGM